MKLPLNKICCTVARARTDIGGLPITALAKFVTNASLEQDPAPFQGRRMIYGLHLPQDVLRAIYHDHAARLFGLKLRTEIVA